MEIKFPSEEQDLVYYRHLHKTKSCSSEGNFIQKYWLLIENLRVACTFSILWLRIQIVFHLSIRNHVEQRETVLFPGFDLIGYFWIWKKFRTSTPSQWWQWFQVFCALFQTSCCTCCQNIFPAKRTFWVNDSFIV